MNTPANSSVTAANAGTKRASVRIASLALAASLATAGLGFASTGINAFAAEPETPAAEATVAGTAATDTAAAEATTEETTAAETAALPSATVETTDVTVTVEVSTTQANELYNLVNSYRVSQGLTGLSYDGGLQSSALQRAAETTVFFDTARPNGATFTQSAAGTVITGQAIFTNAATAQQVLDAWIASPEFSSILTSSTAQSIALAAVQASNGGWYWVALVTDSAPTVSDSDSYFAATSEEQTFTLAVPQANVSAATGDSMRELSLAAGSHVQLYPAVTLSGSLLTDAGNTVNFDSSQQVGQYVSGATWASAQPSVASVDSEGNLNAISAGTTTVTASTASGTTAWTVSVAAPVSALDTEASTAQTYDLAECILVGATDVSFDGEGNPILPEFSITAPDGTTTIDPAQYDAAIHYDAETGLATITVSAVEGASQVTGVLTSTIHPSTAPAPGAEEAPATEEESAEPALEETAQPEVAESDAVSADGLSTDESTEAASGAAVRVPRSVGDTPESADEETTEEPVAQDISFATVSAVAQQTYTGAAIEPKPTVSVGDTVLVEGTDYTLAYANNVDAGVATITITGIGNYTGTRTATFSIVAAGKEELAAAGFTIRDLANATFTGEALTPTFTVSNGSETLVAGQDYTVSYTNNVNAGTATVTVSATEGSTYTGTLTGSFTILPLDMSQVTIVMPNQQYTGQALTPVPQSVTTSSGYTLTAGIDYEISGYINNVNVGKALVTVTGLGNFTGAQNAAFMIAEGTQTGTTETLPKTGDSTSVLPLALAGVAGVALVGTGVGIVLKRKQRKEI